MHAHIFLYLHIVVGGPESPLKYHLSEEHWPGVEVCEW